MPKMVAMVGYERATLRGVITEYALPRLNASTEI
jgi:hypothetical protein